MLDGQTQSRIRKLEQFMLRYKEIEGFPIIVSSSAPPLPNEKSIWIDSDDLVISFQYRVGNNAIWIVPPGAGSLVELDDVDDTDIAVGKILKVGADGITHEYVDDSGGSSDTVQALTYAASIAWDISDGNIGTVKLTGNPVFANPTNLVVGQYIGLEITQDTTGSRTATFGTYFTTPGGINPGSMLSATAGAVDYLEFRVLSATKIRLTNFLPDQKVIV